MRKTALISIITVALVFNICFTACAGGAVYYTVKPGDTLYGIGKKFGLSYRSIMKRNNLTSTLIRPGFKLNIPSEGFDVHFVNASNNIKPVIGNRYLNQEEIHLLAKLIHAEARGESLEGQIAVGAVIMNRLASGRFPESVREVVFQKTRDVYQFTPVQDGQIRLEPNRTSFYAAERAIKGDDPTGGALFFYNPETSADRWIRTLRVTKVIGNHVFAK